MQQINKKCTGTDQSTVIIKFNVYNTRTAKEVRMEMGSIR